MIMGMIAPPPDARSRLAGSTAAASEDSPSGLTEEKEQQKIKMRAACSRMLASVIGRTGSLSYGRDPAQVLAAEMRPVPPHRGQAGSRISGETEG
jgi:hypothetical protein